MGLVATVSGLGISTLAALSPISKEGSFTLLCRVGVRGVLEKLQRVLKVGWGVVGCGGGGVLQEAVVT